MIRPPAVAGLFYPAQTQDLRQTVQALLQTARPSRARPSALIVPHAGYLYSGRVAAAAYANLPQHASRISRVLLLGPSHYGTFDGVVAPSASAFATPLGEVTVDQPSIQQLGLKIDDDAHRREYSLEVQLPFLQSVLGDFCLLPLLLGQHAVAEAERIIEPFLDRDDTLVIVSSDLSHELPRAQTEAMSQGSAEQICQPLSEPRITPEQACGYAAIQALRQVAQHRAGGFVCSSLAHSGMAVPVGDTEGVVGYGAFQYFAGQATESPAALRLIESHPSPEEDEVEAIRQALVERGYYYAHKPDLSRAQVQALCHQFGQAWPDSAALMVVEETREKAFVAHTCDPIEAHNECAYSQTPPRYLGLYCAENSAQGGAFFLLDSEAIMARVEPQYLPSLHRAKFVCTPSEHHSEEVTLVRELRGSTRLIYTGIACCKRRDGMYRLSEAVDEYSQHLLPHLNQIICDPALHQRITWRTGDFLLFENHRFLHGREAFHSGLRQLWHVRVA